MVSAVEKCTMESLLCAMYVNNITMRLVGVDHSVSAQTTWVDHSVYKQNSNILTSRVL